MPAVPGTQHSARQMAESIKKHLLLNRIQSCALCSPIPLPPHSTLLPFPSCPALSSSLSSLSHHCPCSPLIELFWAVTRPEIPRKASSPPANNPELPPFFQASTILGIPFISPSSHVSSPGVGHEGDKASSSNLAASSAEPSSQHSRSPLTSAGSFGHTSQSSLRRGAPVTCANSALVPGGN